MNSPFRSIAFLRSHLALAAIFLALVTTSVCSADIQWAPNVDSAQRVAAASNKLVLLHFQAEWSRPCRDLETFVFSDPGVQRSFAENVVAVRIDSEKELALIEKFGVQKVPFDVVLTPAGKVVIKRPSPKTGSEFSRMIDGLGRKMAKMEQGGTTINKDLETLDQAVRQANSNFKDQKEVVKTASFTPGFPYPQGQGPSFESGELKRKSQVVQNPFVESTQSSGGAAFKPQSEMANVPNQFQANPIGMGPAQTLGPPAQLPPPLTAPAPLKIKNKSALIVPGEIARPEELQLTQQSLDEFAPPVPPGLAGDNSFLPTTESGQQWSSNPVPNGAADEIEAAFSNPKTPAQQVSQSTPQSIPLQLNGADIEEPIVTPDQSFPVKPELYPLRQSDVAAKLIREQAERKVAGFKAEPQRVMADKFYGQQSAQQINQVAGNYQAKINIPQNNNDFVPEPPAMGSADAQIVVNGKNPTPNNPGMGFNASRQNIPAQPVSTTRSMVRPPTPNMAPGLEAAAAKPTPSKFALHGKCPVTLLTETKWVEGDQEFGCVHRNRIYIFASLANLELFKTDPDAYSPILAGYDPVVFAETGRLVDGNEQYGVFMGKAPKQRIVLFASPETRARFQMEPRRYLEHVRQAMVTSGGASSTFMR